MSNLLDNAEKKVLEHFYDEAKHQGAFLFGSIVKGSSEPSDIDVVLFTHDVKNYHHRVENIDNVTYDIFEMSPEYAFYLLQQRRQMWLFSFGMAKQIKGNSDLVSLIDTAKSILESEYYDHSKIDLDKKLFTLNRLAVKLKKYSEDDIRFNILLLDFFNRVHPVLHVMHKQWPDIGSRIDKIDRTFNDFGDYSELLKQILLSQSKEEKLSLISLWLNKINTESGYETPRAIHVETRDVSRQVAELLKQMSEND